MRENLVSWVSVVLVLAGVGCEPAGGVEGWVAGRRAAAESVCGCASAIGQSVESCLEDFDATQIEDAEAVYECVYLGLEADPESEASFDCFAESFWKLDECASSSSCEEDRVATCINRHEVRLSRCEGVSQLYADVTDLCFDRLRVADDPVNRYVRAEATRRGRSAQWQECVRSGFEPNVNHLRDHAACLVPYVDRYNTCVSTDGAACENHLTPTGGCPQLNSVLTDWLAHCDTRF